MFWVIIYLFCEAPSYQFCSSWLNLSIKYSSIYFRIQPASSISSNIIYKHQWFKPYMPMFTMCDTWCGILWIMSSSFLSTYSSLSIVLVKGNLVFLSVQRIFQNWAGFLEKSNLVFLFFSVISGLHLAVNALYLHSWRRLLVVDFDDDGLVSLKEFLHMAWCCGGFFHQQNNSINLQYLSTKVFFLWISHCKNLATPKISGISLIGLFFFFSLMMIKNYLDHLLRFSMNSCLMQIQHLELTPDNLSPY